MSNFIEVTPAYGRDYKTAKAAKEDWNADKDFRDTVTGRYVNKADAKANNLSVIIRFCGNTKVTGVK